MRLEVILIIDLLFVEARCGLKVDIMSNRRKEIVFKWFIENYSYCWHKNGEILISPEFTDDDLEGTVWCLYLYPRGRTDKQQNSISLSYVESWEDDGPEDFPLKFELALLAADGSPLISKEMEFTFKKNFGNGISNLIRMDDVLLRRKVEFLQDTLSVRCKIWIGEGITEHVTEIRARTRIEIEQFSFLHVIENFSALKSNQMKTVQIKHPSKKKCAVSNSVYVTDASCCERKIIVKTMPHSLKQILCKYKLSLLNASGVFVKCGEADNRCDPDRQNIDSLPLTLTQEAIMSNKSEYLPDDRLSVFCECVFSTGEEYKMHEKTLYEIPTVLLNQLNDDDQNSDEEDSSDYTTALDDLIAVYNNQFLTDVELKTKTKSFFAHKIMLCARSSVFKVMMSNDMKEKNTGCIQIDDLDNDTVQQLLLFLYSDHLENLHWESATKLYYAADKYEIKKLKVICSDFLEDNLSTSTAAELLVLANAHNDFNLKKVAEDFILEHEQEVFGSVEWEKLIETDPKLVIKTMHLKYKRNKVL
ncbi:TD and POZ domain-containing protein 5 [Argiope bruennichi]|uniref:TD and POZ domain-containing protein 5 n=1 Tax=Argiope bruennichi TaxID=94029 RepID=A0A8T0EQT0_ARGBR|nr:TD and POZ domain-containing protein 5 [Argiope bruennichi]